MFLGKLEEENQGFANNFSVIFCDFSSPLKISHYFISSYLDILMLLNQKSSSSKFTEAMRQLSLDLDTGKDFQSYLISPIQRCPRYILFLKELKKYTPKCHPDYELINLAFKKYQKFHQSLTEKFRGLKS
jgi:hypothetical protein